MKWWLTDSFKRWKSIIPHWNPAGHLIPCLFQERQSAAGDSSWRSRDLRKTVGSHLCGWDRDVHRQERRYMDAKMSKDRQCSVKLPVPLTPLEAPTAEPRYSSQFGAKLWIVMHYCAGRYKGIRWKRLDACYWLLKSCIVALEQQHYLYVITRFINANKCVACTNRSTTCRDNVRDLWNRFAQI